MVETTHFRKSSGEAPTRRIPKLLCVDDDPLLVDSMERQLRRYDAEFLWAYSGCQAYWLAAQQKPDVIITDWRMPDGGGEELIQWVRGNSLLRSTAIVIVSGLLSEPIKRHLLENRLVDHIFDKPLNTERFIETLRTMFPLHRRLRPRDIPPGYHVDELQLSYPATPVVQRFDLGAL